MPIISPSLSWAATRAHPDDGRAAPAADGERSERQCGRCRRYFDADAAHAALQEWWLCAPCHDTLFGVDR